MSHKLKILITEPYNYSPVALKNLRSLGQVTLLENRADFMKKIVDVDVLVVKLNFQITAAVINAAPKLKLVATSTTGLNHIDVAWAQKRGVAVLSLRGQSDFLQNIHSTGEQTLTLILALIRKLPWSFDSIKKETWQREKYYGHEIHGKTLGILGYGRLGKIVAGYGQCLGLKVIAHDPYVAKKDFVKNKVQAVSFDDLFRQADILSVHVLLTPETENLVKEKHLRLMKPTSIFINTARGEIVDERALLMVLQKKVIAGAALDVVVGERPDGSHLKKNSLVEYAQSYDNLIITPHLGGATFEAMAATENFLTDKIKEWYEKKL